jgi:ADP-dependent phosphofructokinase/glucokinase
MNVLKEKCPEKYGKTAKMVLKLSLRKINPLKSSKKIKTELNF